MIRRLVTSNSIWRGHWAPCIVRSGGSSFAMHVAAHERKSPISLRPVVTTTTPAKGNERKRKLFLENLPKDVTDDEVFDFMSQLGGKIERAKIAVRVNSQSTGLGTVVFETVRDAKQASRELQNKMLRGCKVVIHTTDRSWRTHPHEARSVFVANIPPATSQSDLLTHFKRVGDVVSLQLPQDENGRLLGHAFIEFVHPSQAEKAVQMLNHTTLQGRILSVRQHANDTDVIHVSQLPENVPATELYKLFGEVGELAYVHLPSAGRATVKYVSPHDAVKAVQVVSGATIFGNMIKVVLAHERKTMKAAGTVATSSNGQEPTLNKEAHNS